MKSFLPLWAFPAGAASEDCARAAGSASSRTADARIIRATIWPGLITPISFSTPASLSSARLRDDVHEGRLAALHYVDGALDCRTQFLGIGDGALAIYAHALREFGVVDVRAGDGRSGAAVGNVAAMAVSHDLHLHHFLVVGAIVVHDVQHGNLVMRGGPQNSGREHQIAVALDVDGQAAIFAVGQRRAR